MKSIKKFAVIPVLVCVFSLCAGCNTTSYGIYTNIPDGGYSITDSAYTLSGTISGYESKPDEYEKEDTTSYKVDSRMYPSLFAEADVVVWTDGDNDSLKNFFTDVASKLNAIDRSISATITGSDLYNFNNALAGAKLEINDITYEVLTKAKAVYELTDGYYNPALYYNVEAYGFGNAEAYPKYASQLPAEDIIAKYTDLASHFSDLVLSEEDGKYYVQKPSYTVEVEGETLSMKLDLGGIGKGYAVDEVNEIYDEYGFKYGYMNFAASSMVVKSHPEFGEYTVSLTNPRSPQRNSYMEIPAREQKLSTSGDNEKFYLIDGVRYCHIIDPTTGSPVRAGITSVTVIGGNAAEDDALTTAIMAMGRERAIKFIEEKLNDRRVVFTCE